VDSDRLNRWLALAANIGVLVGIVFLAVEIRQNTIAVQTAALQQHFEQHTGLVMARVNNAELRAAFLKTTDGTEMLSAEEEAILAPYIISVIRNHFVAYELRESGLLPDSQWRTFRAALIGTMRRQFSRDIWRSFLGRNPDVYSNEFQEVVDGRKRTLKID
jgi:hypothetical protein